MKTIPSYITEIYSSMIEDYFSSIGLDNLEGRVSKLERSVDPTNYFEKASEACNYQIEKIGMNMGIGAAEVLAKRKRMAENMVNACSLSDEMYNSVLEMVIKSLQQGGYKPADAADENMA